MNREIQRFVFESNEVRIVVKEDGDPLFCAVDVCRALDIDDVGSAVSRLDEDEKTKNIQPRFETGGVAPAAEFWFVTEPGLFRLILGSRKLAAKRFQRWVTHEVLPSIRRTGGYGKHEASEALAAQVAMLAEQVREMRAQQWGFVYAQIGALDARMSQCERGVKRIRSGVRQGLFGRQGGSQRLPKARKEQRALALVLGGRS